MSVGRAKLTRELDERGNKGDLSAKMPLLWAIVYIYRPGNFFADLGEFVEVTAGA